MTTNTQLKKIFSVTVITALLSACQPAKVETPKAAGGDKPFDAGSGGLLQAVGAGEGACRLLRGRVISSVVKRIKVTIG